MKVISTYYKRSNDFHAQPIIQLLSHDQNQTHSVNNELVNNPPENNTPALIYEVSDSSVQSATSSLAQISTSAAESRVSDKVSVSTNPTVTTNKPFSSTTIISSEEESKNIDVKTYTKDKLLKVPVIAFIIIIPAVLITIGVLVYLKYKKRK